MRCDGVQLTQTFCMHVFAEGCRCTSYTVWTLIFAVLNSCGFRGSTAIRESLVPRKLKPALTGQRIVHFDEQ